MINKTHGDTFMDTVSEERSYIAFISYRHTSPDKEIADKLQKKLEMWQVSCLVICQMR